MIGIEIQQAERRSYWEGGIFEGERGREKYQRFFF